MINDFSLLTIIVNRGRGSKILQFACSYGAGEASCFLGRGTIKNNVLKFLNIDDVDKEIILIVVPSGKESEFLNELSEKFHFNKRNHGIAFTTPLSSIIKLKSGIVYNRVDKTVITDSKYSCLFMIVNNGMADYVIETSQNAGYFGGTIIKALGGAGHVDVILNMNVEPKKEAVLMLTETDKVEELANLLTDKLDLDKENTGILVVFETSRVIGLYEENNDEK